ncbi:hypothetical protein L1049_014579 [Liquidambar formosana]|uniref:DUF7788 domain-containing protein n=1 Tax=Liquidambar formosana TaxID=63359 RepID=A0AAP0X5V6_LIQFO
MVKRIFVFSSMEFEVAAKNVWETDYRAAWKSYRNRGYKTVPEIVFWNLKANSIASPVVYSSPVDDKHKGLSLMTGFSKSMLCVFFKGDGVLKLEDVKKLALVPEPEDVMKSAISGEEYQNLIVFD